MKGVTLAIIAALLFSLYPSLSKILINADVSPILIILTTQFLAVILLAGFLDLTGKMGEFKKVSGHDLAVMGAVSVFTSVVAPLLFLFGLSMTSATNAILISSSEALIISFLAVFFFNDKISFHQVAGAIIMMTGVAVMATNNFSDGLVFSAGDIIILGSAASYAVGTMLFKKYMRHIHPEVIVILRNMFGSCMLLAISFFLIDYSGLWKMMTPNYIAVLLGLVIISTILAQYFWYRALEAASAVKVALTMLLGPLIAVFYAIVLLGEKLTWPQVQGGVLIMAGLVVLEFHFRKVRTVERMLRHLQLRHWHRI